MKFLIDMNLSPLWTAAFGDQGFEATHWSRVGDPEAPDHRLMQWARTHGHVVFTHDPDFSRMLALTRAEGPSFLQLRSQAVLPDDAGPLVFAAVRQHKTFLEGKAPVVVDVTTSRARLANQVTLANTSPNIERLAAILREAGADLDLRWKNTGHALIYEALQEAKEWLSEPQPERKKHLGSSSQIAYAYVSCS